MKLPELRSGGFVLFLFVLYLIDFMPNMCYTLDKRASVCMLIKVVRFLLYLSDHYD